MTSMNSRSLGLSNEVLYVYVAHLALEIFSKNRKKYKATVIAERDANNKVMNAHKKFPRFFDSK